MDAVHADTGHEELRPLMFSIAYRMHKLRHLGATSEAFVQGDR